MGAYSRRGFLVETLLAMAAWPRMRTEGSRASIELVLAPSNLGLSPSENEPEPGTWRAPAALMAAGLDKRVRAQRVVPLARPAYATVAQHGTGIRNGETLRRFSLDLADAVVASLQRGAFPLVIGGDCS